MTQKTAEQRSFGMHPNLLFDVILRQAGSLQKAILEGVMNAIDAGSTKCEITLETHRFIIEDDGRGIQTRDEIKRFFETFGTPHKQGDATYGKFRMGRGQILAYGRSLWRSRQFEMDCDIKKRGLSYELTEHETINHGTRITTELYDPIPPSDLERIKNELRKFVAYAQIPVFLNGTQIATPAKECKWPYEDEHAYYKLSADQNYLTIYNLGVLVCSNYAGNYGVGGIVVSKQQLDINFARNDVMSSCPVFKKIQAYVKKQSTEKATRKTKLTAAEQQLLTQNFLAGEASFNDIEKLKLLTDVNGRSWPLKKLQQLPQNFSSRICVAEKGDMFFEAAMRNGLSFSLSNITLERFGVSSLEQFKTRLLGALALMIEKEPRNYTLSSIHRTIEHNCTITTRDDLSGLLTDTHIPIVDKDLKPEMKLMLDAVSASMSDLINALNRIEWEDTYFKNRKLHIGQSETAFAWTDGTTSIWIEEKHIKLIKKGFPGAHQLAQTILHEMLHSEPDTATHQHDAEFYQAFHDLCGHPIDPVGKMAKKMIAIFMSLLRSNNKKINLALFAQDDFETEFEALTSSPFEEEPHKLRSVS